METENHKQNTSETKEQETKINIGEIYFDVGLEGVLDKEEFAVEVQKMNKEIENYLGENKNSSVYKALVPQFRKDELPTDPKDPDFYYGYKSSDGKNYELTARLENLDDVECKNQKEVCIFTIKFP